MLQYIVIKNMEGQTCLFFKSTMHKRTSNSPLEMKVILFTSRVSQTDKTMYQSMIDVRFFSSFRILIRFKKIKRKIKYFQKLVAVK